MSSSGTGLSVSLMKVITPPPLQFRSSLLLVNFVTAKDPGVALSSSFVSVIVTISNLCINSLASGHFPLIPFAFQVPSQFSVLVFIPLLRDILCLGASLDRVLIPVLDFIVDFDCEVA